MLDIILRVLRFFTSLKTAAQQLLAVLISVIIVLGIWLVSVYKELRKVEAGIPKTVATAVESQRQLSAIEISLLRKENESLKTAVSDEKSKSYDFVKDLLEEQKALNARREEVDKTQSRLASQNRRHVNIIKKDAKQLIEAIKAQ